MTTKIGLDIHGVIDNNPKFFIDLAKRYDQVYIITGGSCADGRIENELLAYNNGEKFWHVLFSVYDHLKSVGAKTNEELGNASRWPFPDETWNHVKAEYCEKEGIDMHIDDMMEYLIHFRTPYMLHKDPTRNHRGQFGTHAKD